MVDITTEQHVSFVFQVKDGRGRPKPVEGTPTAVSSDETVATVTLTAGDGTAWNGDVTSVAPGSARIAVNADADLGEGVQDVIGTMDVVVTLDDRTGARMVELTAGTPEDKPV
jgi:hypothetical protein